MTSCEWKLVYKLHINLSTIIFYSFLSNRESILNTLIEQDNFISPDLFFYHSAYNHQAWQVGGLPGSILLH